jgi:hypothetical protein
MRYMPLLAATVLALAGILAAEVTARPARTPPPAAQRSPAAQAAAPSPDRASAHTEEWVRVILARPLMMPGRRPDSVAPAAQAAAATPDLPRLSGIMVADGQRSAIFEGASRPTSLHEGGRVGPYTVLAIRAGQVDVLGPAGPQTLRPRFGQPASGQADGQAATRPVPADVPSDETILGRLVNGAPPAPGAVPPPPTLRGLMNQNRNRAGAQLPTN